VSRDGRNIGLIQLSDKLDDSAFTEDDEAALVQLALMASAAIEHVELREQLEERIHQLGWRPRSAWHSPARRLSARC
jgi:GAF domain-containing protein